LGLGGFARLGTLQFGACGYPCLDPSAFKTYYPNIACGGTLMSLPANGY